MAHEHDPNKPAEMCDEHLRQHGATVVAELLNRDLLVIGTPNHAGDGLSLQHVLSMGVGDEKVYISRSTTTTGTTTGTGGTTTATKDTTTATKDTTTRIEPGTRVVR